MDFTDKSAFHLDSSDDQAQVRYDCPELEAQAPKEVDRKTHTGAFQLQTTVPTLLPGKGRHGPF